MPNAFRLRDTKVFRAPRSDEQGSWWHAEHGRLGEPTRIEASEWARDGRKARIHFDLTYGPGYSSICVAFGAGDFNAILKAMCRVDREEALAAMSAVLAKNLAVEKPSDE